MCCNCREVGVLGKLREPKSDSWRDELILRNSFDMPNKQSKAPRCKSVAIVAPAWMQNTLSLWLQELGKIELVIGTTQFSALNISLVPDLLICFVPSEQVEAQIQLIKQKWPTTRLLLIVEEPQSLDFACKVRQYAPDVTLLFEPSIKQLLSVIHDWFRETSGALPSLHAEKTPLKS